MKYGRNYSLQSWYKYADQGNDPWQNAALSYLLDIPMASYVRMIASEYDYSTKRVREEMERILALSVSDF